MGNYQELVFLIDVVDCTMVFIIWRIAENDLTKYYVREVHLGIDKFSLRVAILRTWHLVEKLSK
jgi:hypothetical protein